MAKALSEAVRREQLAWSSPETLTFFDTHRSRIEHLYPSERHFLLPTLRQVKTVLDVGCAAGGFSAIMKSINAGISYTGLDINPEFVAKASQRYPDSTFAVGDGLTFATLPGSYDLVHASGVLHLNSQYREIVDACYAQASTYLLCDFRLTRGKGQTGTFAVDFGGLQTPPLPYIVLNVDEALAWLKSLVPSPAEIDVYGYYSPPSHMAQLELEQVITAFVLVRKGKSGSGPTLTRLEIPD